MSGDTRQTGTLASVQALLNIVRDGLLLVLFLLLLLLPNTLNRILSDAGFTRASFMGFDWEARLDQAVQQTESAKQDVDRLNRELGEYAFRIEQIARQSTEPASREAAQGLAGSMRGTQAAAAEIGVSLGRNVAMQRELKVELRDRIQPPRR